MALTTAQENAELRQIMGRFAAMLHPRHEAYTLFLRACIAQIRAAGANDVEGGKFWAQQALETMLGRPATAADLHYLRNHLTTEADETAGGVV